MRAFYWMRAARILPCLLLLLALLSALHLAGVPEYVIPPERASLGRAVLAALTFHFNSAPSNRALRRESRTVVSAEPRSG